MIDRVWDLDDLRFTKKGYSIIYKEGQVVDRLIVMEYVGKYYIPSRDTWCPVYRCLCDCGNQEYRTQEYLARRRKNGKTRHKWCNKCASKAISIATSKSNGRRYDHVTGACEGHNPELVDSIIKAIWTHADGLGGPVYCEHT